MEYGGRSAGKHGGGGGGRKTFPLNRRAKIVQVTGRAGSRVDELGFVASDGNVFGPYGGGGGAPFVSLLGHDCFLAFFEGRSGRRIDQISLWWQCPEGYEIEYRPQVWANNTLTTI